MTDAKQLARADLERSGISLPDASWAGFGVVEDARLVLPLYPVRDHPYAAAPALVMPYIDPWTGAPMEYRNGSAEPSPFARIRYLDDLPKKPGANPFKAPKEQRYTQPPNSGVFAYFPTVRGKAWPDVASDPTWPVLIVEGEKKALAAMLQGFATIGLGGVHNFYNAGAFLPELERFQWKGRPVYICFDSDAAQNPQIQAAEGRLATELSQNRGVVLHLVRFPSLPGGDKQGIDDYLLREGADALDGLLAKAPRMRKIDAAVVALNAHVAWIEKEGCVYDVRSKEFILKNNFTNGSVYSTLKVISPTVKGTGVKEISVAEEWLKHPHAQRYDYVEFKPDDNSPVLHTDMGGLAINMWTGFQPRTGDVSPFLELSEYLFADLALNAELPLSLMAYKAQNPGIKVPLALVLVGPQGCGKSLWAECVRDAFQPYTAEIPCGALGDQFNGWTERTLINVINEAQEDVLRKAAPRLRALISDKRTMLNEKFRLARQIDSYTQYILTSNDRGAAAFAGDDRRMVVVSCPRKRDDAFYRRVAEWKFSGGGKRLLNWFLTVDLEGWQPPLMAPMTAEKYMAYVENLSPIQHLAEEMQTANESVILMWIHSALSWANVAVGSPNASQVRLANEVIDSLSSIPIRPFYTPEELALMFPAIANQMHGFRERGVAAPSGLISKELRSAGINYLRNADDPRGFRWRGLLRQFLIVAEPEEWTQPITQNQFDLLMVNFPTYKQYREGRKRNNG